jgi:hypothetical protein
MRNNKTPTAAPESVAAELEKCKQEQATMKAVNAHFRKCGTCVGAPGITEMQAQKLDEKVRSSEYSWERQPFSSYTLTNNNSAIKRLEKKLKEVSRGFAGWEFEGGRAEANEDIDRLQLFFNERPDDQQKKILKSYGFKWAPSQEAWQRQLTDNAIYSAGRISFIKPSDGRTVREHQPKMPVKDMGAR